MLRGSRTTLLVLTVAGGIVLGKLVLEDVLGIDLGLLVTSMPTDSRLAPAALVAGLLIIDILLPVPSSLVMIAAGRLLGMTWGTTVALAGSLAGQWLGYELARAWGRPLATRFAGTGDISRMESLLARHGAAMVVATRALPIALETTSLVAGLARMPRATYLAAAALGTAPIVAIYAWAGAYAGDTGNLIPGAILLLALGGTGWMLSRRTRRARPPSSAASRD